MIHVPARARRLALALVLAFVTAASAARAEDARLVLLHTTDLHGAFDGWDYGRDQPGHGGLPRIATLVRRVRAEGAGVVLLDAGDAVQGGASSLFAHDESRHPDPVIAEMSALGYDAMAVGNHEFDFGRDALSTLRGSSRFAWLAANVVLEGGASVFDASKVLTVAGVRVGIVGVCTPAVPKFESPVLIEGLRFLDPVEPARREVERLRKAEHCDVVVLLAHTGLERDPKTNVARAGDTPDENWGDRLAEQVPGVDAVILGHTHVVIPSAKIGGTLVTQAGAHGTSLGRIDVALSRPDGRSPWVVGEIRARVIAVSDTLTEDPELSAIAAPYREEARSALATVLGATARPLSAPAGRAADNPLWQLIQRAQLAASHADVSLAALPDPSVVIPAGPIRQRDLLRLYPYENTLGAVELTGAQLKQVLEHSAECLETYDFSEGRPLFRPDRPLYNFDMAAGVEYDIDPGRAPGDRIVNLRFAGAPLDPARKLKVAVNSYREFGGGGFPAIAEAPRVWQSPRTVRAAIADLLADHPTLEPDSLPGWRLLPATAATPERDLVDRLVRGGVVSKDEVMSIDTMRVVSRGRFREWLTRAMGRKFALHGSRPDRNDARALTLGAALETCEKVARAARYTLSRRSPDDGFRRSLLCGTSFADLALPPAEATLRPEQALGLIANLRFPVIRVLETTDFHGAILQAGRDRATGRAVGGSAVLAAWIDKLRAENPEGTVLLDGGDWYQGTMISNLQFGRPVIEQMNALGYAAAAIGNHEFDWTADTLEQRASELKCSALGANMIERKTGRRPRWVGADTVFARRGMRIGVLGLCYPETPVVTLPRNVAHLRFDDDSTTAAHFAPELDHRSDVRIVVGHIPSQNGRGDLLRLAHVAGYDLFLGGHGHNQVLSQVGDVPYMVSGSHGQIVGVCDLVVDGLSRRVIERHARLQATFRDAIEPDSAMAARVERWNANVAPIAGQVLCRNATRLVRNRGGESNLGDFVADAMRNEVNAEVALQNSGGLRADLAEGVVTRGSIYEVMPFDNTLVTMRLNGDELRKVLEDGFAFGHVPQISGIRISYDLSRPPGHRLIVLAQSDGQPVDRTYRYRVVVNNFMAEGGDNYDSLVHARDLTDTGINVRDALERYVVAQAKANGGVLDFHPVPRILRGPGHPRRE